MDCFVAIAPRNDDQVDEYLERQIAQIDTALDMLEWLDTSKDRRP